MVQIRMTIKIKELRQNSEEELNKKKDELRKELLKLNAQVATGTTPKSPGQIKDIKKTVARIETVLQNKEKKKQ